MSPRVIAAPLYVALVVVALAFRGIADSVSWAAITVGDWMVPPKERWKWR